MSRCRPVAGLADVVVAVAVVVVSRGLDAAVAGFPVACCSKLLAVVVVADVVVAAAAVLLLWTADRQFASRQPSRCWLRTRGSSGHARRSLPS